MSFVGVGLDGSAEELDDFVSSQGVEDIVHITDDTHANEIDQLFAEYSVNAVPTFVIIQAGGESRLRSGWNEGQLRDDIDWLESA